MPDLDQAFAALTSDIAQRVGRPGAAEAIATSRRRRRTTIATAALAAGLIVGSVAAGAHVLGRGSDPTRTTTIAASPGELTPEALTQATRGWTGPWETAHLNRLQAMSAPEGSSLGCFAGALSVSGGGGPEPQRFGDRFLASGDSLALVVFAELAGPADASTYRQEIDQAVATHCGTGSSAGATATYYAAGSTEDVWSIQDGSRVAIMLVDEVGSDPGADVVATVTSALASALATDASFTYSDGLTTGDTTSEGEAGTETGSVLTPAVSLGELKGATGGWPVEARAQGPGLQSELPCAAEPGTDRTQWGGGSTLGDRGLLSFAGLESPASALGALGRSLRECSSVRWTVHEDHGALWAYSDSGTVVGRSEGSMVAWVSFTDVTPPTDAEAAAVQDFLLQVIRQSAAAEEVSH